VEQFSERPVREHLIAAAINANEQRERVLAQREEACLPMRQALFCLDLFAPIAIGEPVRLEDK
jgi:hypothetical protein